MLDQPTFRTHYAHTPFGIGHGTEWRNDGHSLIYVDVTGKSVGLF